MSQVINTNVLSLNAQRNLSNSQGALAQSLERLSSGLRINSAKDDAAGLAISERFTTQIRGLNQAVRNSNDGISLAQTGEGALQEVQNNLQRIRELAVQSANATNSESDREALNREVQQRLEEIDRVSSQTSFNGQKILDGSFGDAKFQVGANVGETIDLNLESSTRLDALGSLAVAEGDLASVFTDAIATTSGADTGFTDGTSDAAGEEFTLSIDNETVFSKTSGAASESLTGAEVQEAIDAFVENSDGAYTKTGSLGDGDLVISRTDGSDMEIALVNEWDSGDFNNSTFVATHTDGEEAGTLEVSDDFNITVGDLDPVAVADGEYANADELLAAVSEALGDSAFAAIDADGNLRISSDQAISFDGAAATELGFAEEYEADSGNLGNADVLTVFGANDVIQRVDVALTEVSDIRSDFGAIQNRFESTISNLTQTTENLEASRSRIRDADFASETAELTRAQILQQAGTSVLSQANAVPQNALALLQ
ncbi:flagellin [Thioalkalivibrio sp. AKL19]|uniref:flagellin n=1 Tax=Thioalkalivibrio sp. AKL19 TaxID=1266914 RepID=UPI00040500E8|nr:flagellin [Thioalkalivibrio sp. AKL19]